jgi:hypothetical protein
MNISEYLDLHPVEFGVVPIPERTDGWINSEPDGKKWEAFHYRVSISSGRNKLAVEYSKGSGLLRWKNNAETGRAVLEHHSAGVGHNLLKKMGCKPGASYRGASRGFTIAEKAVFDNCIEPEPPTVDEVLMSLAQDAQSLENSPVFEDWCGEYGFDTDSRKAEAVFRKVQDTSARLRKVLGEAAYRRLINEVRDE